MDELTGGVDLGSRRNFWDLIYDLSRSGYVKKQGVFDPERVRLALTRIEGK
nr:hypothetical protein [Moorella glycerini]